MILTSTFFIVLITVLVNGGCTTYLVDALGLKQRQGYLALLHEEGRQPHRNRCGGWALVNRGVMVNYGMVSSLPPCSPQPRVVACRKHHKQQAHGCRTAISWRATNRL